MIEPGVRYLPLPLQLPPQPQVSLEAAVDLTKKSENWKVEPEHDEPDDGSDSDTPMDLTRDRLTPVFPGFRPDRDVSPLGRPLALYSPGSMHRDRSTDRSDLDKGKSTYIFNFLSPEHSKYFIQNIFKDFVLNIFMIPDEYARDGCHICGMPRSEMSAYEHGEGVCNQRPIACPLCSKTFTLWSHYETHKKCHQKLKQRQYPCQSCGKVGFNHDL